MIDWKEDTNNDLLLQDGDIVLGESTMQHQRDILLSNKGDYAQAPTTSVGLFSYLDGETPNEMISEIRERFNEDGMTIKQLTIINANISIDANY